VSEDLEEPRFRIPGPKEGWMSVLLLGIMLLSLAWAVQSAGWLDQTEFLIPVTLWGLALGLGLGVSRLSVAVTIPLSALVGAGIVLWSIGGEYHPELDQLRRLDAMRAVGIDAALSAVRFGSIQQAVVMAIGFGVLVWTTAYTASFVVYRRRHVLDAILLVGAFLVLNLVATVRDEFFYLVLFALASLLLWLRASLVERRTAWQTRRVTENLDVPASIMRSGVIFTAISIGLAWVLTTVAVAAPLTTAVRSLDQLWLDFATEASGFFQGLNTSGARPLSAGYGDSLTVGPSWTTSTEPVLRLRAERPYYLAARTYDHYDGRGWEATGSTTRQVEAGADVFPGWTPDRPQAAEGFEAVTVTVEILKPHGRDIWTPGFPVEFFAPTLLTETGGQPTFGRVQATGSLNSGQMYDVTAVVSSVTEAQLAAASTEYEPEVTALYLDTTGVTERTRRLAEGLVAGVEPDPYHRAKAIAAYLRSEGFAYDTSVVLPSDPSIDMVDHFLFSPDGQRGFCVYYASAMVTMARSVGIPARFVVGYAPGERVEDGIFEITSKGSHAWAELYFPGYGWQIFEATKSINPRFARASGDPSSVAPVLPNRGVDAGPYGPGAALSPQKYGEPAPSYQPIAGGHQAGDEPVVADQAREGNAWIFLALIGLALLFGLVRWFSARRRFRFLSAGDRGWARLNLAAQRAGIGREPSETIYEYASWLEAELPSRATEIRTIADGKVWSAYSGRSMSERAIEAIERAWDRLRVPLTALAIRRRVSNILRRPI
jgi:transglutaminase-like putative cysteine protease